MCPLAINGSGEISMPREVGDADQCDPECFMFDRK